MTGGPSRRIIRAAKVAVLADVHRNLPALQAVVEDLQRIRPVPIVYGGDLALGGPRAVPCIDLIREHG